jgi:hypothetical protein
MESISTIAISRRSRDMLKNLGNKGQTYDEIIQHLVGLKRKKEQDSPDREVGSLQSSESRNPPEFANPMSQDTQPTQVNKNLCDCNGCSLVATKETEVNVGELGIIRLNLCENCILKFKSSIKTENNKIAGSSRDRLLKV